MRCQTIVSTLALATTALVAQAAEFAGEDWTCTVTALVQPRLAFAATADEAGQDMDNETGINTGDAQAYSLTMRRARLTLAATTRGGWSYALGLEADRLGQRQANGTLNDEWGVDDAWIAKTWGGAEPQRSAPQPRSSGRNGAFGSTYGRQGARLSRPSRAAAASTLTQELKVGFESWGDYGHSAIADTDRSAQALFPNTRPSAFLASVDQGGTSVEGLTSDEMGLGYRLVTERLSWSIAFAQPDSKGPGGEDGADIFLATRLATAIDRAQMQRSESFLGAPGWAQEIGLAATWKDSVGDASIASAGVDYLLHADCHSLLVEALTSFIDYGGANGRDDGLAISAQYGYALQQADGLIYEPALRLALLDQDVDVASEPGSLIREGGASGLYLDLGFNCYFDGHRNKLQLGLQYYEPEGGDGSGTVLRLQHQLAF